MAHYPLAIRGNTCLYLYTLHCLHYPDSLHTYSPVIFSVLFFPPGGFSESYQTKFRCITTTTKSHLYATLQCASIQYASVLYASLQRASTLFVIVLYAII